MRDSFTRLETDHCKRCITGERTYPRDNIAIIRFVLPSYFLAINNDPKVALSMFTSKNNIRLECFVICTFVKNFKSALMGILKT